MAVQRLYKKFYFDKVLKPCDDSSRWVKFYNHFYEVVSLLNKKVK